MDGSSPVTHELIPTYPIMPLHINTQQHFWNAFDHAETEVSAMWIVRFMQQANVWAAFTTAEIQTFYNGQGDELGRLMDNFRFNQLFDQREHMIITGHDGQHRVTHAFICKCFQSSPYQGGVFV